MARRNIWEHLWESTEGPTVQVTLPRELADALLQGLAASLEQDMPDDDMGDMDDDDLDFGGDDDIDASGDPPDGMQGLGPMDDLDMMAAGDGDDDEDDEPPPPKKKGPGRPPKSDKKKDKGGDEDDKDDDDEDQKDEAADYGHSGGDPSGFDPSNALGESAWSQLGEKYIGFDKLARKVGPGVAANIGRAKYGKKRFQAAAAKGKKLG